MPTLHVVMPFYNEGNTIRPCVERVLRAPLPEGWSRAIVLVDDHSDPAHGRTVDALTKEVAADGHRLEVCRHQRNQGKGAALRTGFDAVLAADPSPDDLVIVQDADLEYDPADFPRLLAPLAGGDADAVLGSRWGDHRQVRGLKRRLHLGANAVLTRLSNWMTGYRLRDMECCYKVVTVRLLRRLRPWLTESRYGVEPQIVAVLAALKARVVEVPVSYDPRGVAEGKKIGWTDGVRALYVIGRERFRRIEETEAEGADA